MKCEELARERSIEDLDELEECTMAKLCREDDVYESGSSTSRNTTAEQLAVETDSIFNVKPKI